jgi:hypothetical protein
MHSLGVKRFPTIRLCLMRVKLLRGGKAGRPNI